MIPLEGEDSAHYDRCTRAGRESVHDGEVLAIVGIDDRGCRGARFLPNVEEGGKCFGGGPRVTVKDEEK